MFGATQADAFGTEVSRRLGVERRFSIGPYLQAAVAVSPAHQDSEIAGKLRLDARGGALEDLALAAVNGDDLAFGKTPATGAEKLGWLINLDFARSGDARTPHTPRHHGRVAGHPAPRCDHTLGGVHAVNVFWTCFFPHQNHRLAEIAQAFGLVSRKDNATRSSARRCGQTLRDDLTLSLRVDGGVEELVKRGGLDPPDSLGLADEALIGKVDSDS